jgi:hypothetical protein
VKELQETAKAVYCTVLGGSSEAIAFSDLALVALRDFAVRQFLGLSFTVYYICFFIQI